MNAPALPIANALSCDMTELRTLMDDAVRRVRPSWMRSHHDDIVQVAMLRLLRIQRRRGASWAFNAAYVRRIARSTTLNTLRRVRPDRELVEDTLDASVPSRTADPVTHLESKRLADSIRHGLEQLTASRRDAVRLYLAGHRIKEVAGAMRCDAKRAENLIYRGLAQLRRHLTAHGWQPLPRREAVLAQ